MKKLMLWAIACYQKRGVTRLPCCHYIPSCSEYARIAIERYGAVKGGGLAVRRVLRCHPFTRREPYDPVP